MCTAFITLIMYEVATELTGRVMGGGIVLMTSEKNLQCEVSQLPRVKKCSRERNVRKNRIGCTHHAHESFGEKVAPST